MKHSTLCAQALLDHAIKTRNYRFFVDRFGCSFKQCALTDYNVLLSILERELEVPLQFLSTKHQLSFSQVPHDIREFIVLGGRQKQAQRIFNLNENDAKRYYKACLGRVKNMKFEKYIPPRILKELLAKSRCMESSYLNVFNLISWALEYDVTISLIIKELGGEK